VRRRQKEKQAERVGRTENERNREREIERIGYKEIK